MGNLDKAQSLCHALLAEYPDYVGALQTLGLVYLAKNSYLEALLYFMRANMEAPKDWTNLTNLAKLYGGLGAMELAAQAADLCGASVPDAPLPTLGDDSGCSKPYSELISVALAESKA